MTYGQIKEHAWSTGHVGQQVVFNITVRMRNTIQTLNSKEEQQPLHNNLALPFIIKKTKVCESIAKDSNGSSFR